MPQGRLFAAASLRVPADLWLCLALTLAVGAVSPWFAGIRSGNELSRVYLTEALLVDGSLAIDGPMARHGDVRDKSQYNSAHYSDKAPGVSLVALPAVALYRAVSSAPTLEGEVRASRWAAAVLPTLLLLWGLLGWLRELCDAGTSRALVTLAALGSLGTTYGTLLFGHQLAGACVLHAFLSARRLRGPPGKDTLRAAALAGFFAGAAVLTEYPSAVPLLPIGVAFAVWVGRRPGPWLAALAGVALPLGLLLGYHALAFGHPLHTGYRYVVNPFFASLHAQGFMGVGWPRFGRLHFHLWSPRKGLWFFAPWLVLAVPGLFCAVRALRRSGGPTEGAPRPMRPALRGDAAVTVAVVVLWLLLLLGMAYDNGGWTLGQRHLTGLVPWLVWLVALALGRWPFLRPAMVGWGLVALVLTGVATSVYPYYPEHARHPSLQYGLHFALAGVEGGGLWASVGVGSLVGGVLVAVLAALGLLRWLRSWRSVAVALVLAGLHLGLVAALGPPRSPDARRDRVLAAVQARSAATASTASPANQGEPARGDDDPRPPVPSSPAPSVP